MIWATTGSQLVDPARVSAAGAAGPDAFSDSISREIGTTTGYGVPALDPFVPVQTGDAAYRWLAELEQAGLVHPSQSLSAPLSRYEFALSLAEVLQRRLNGAGSPSAASTSTTQAGHSAAAETSTQKGEQVTEAAPGVGVRAPIMMTVDAQSVDRVVQGVDRKYAAEVRTALTSLLVQFGPELQVLGFDVQLPASRQLGLSMASLAGPQPWEDDLKAAPLQAKGVTGSAGWSSSPLEWSYQLGLQAANRAGMSLETGSGQQLAGPAGWSELALGQAGMPTVQAGVIAGPVVTEVSLVSPPGDIMGVTPDEPGTPVIGLDTRWQVSEGTALHWWWGTPMQPEAAGKSSLASVGQGELTAIGGTLAITPQVSLEGEVARHGSGDGAGPQTGASRVGASVALGNVLVGASYRWVDPGFRPLLPGGDTPTSGSTLNMQVRRSALQVEAKVDRSQGDGTSSGSTRQVVALGLTYDLNNLAVLRAGYEWADLWATPAGGQPVATSQRRLQVGIGMQQGSSTQGVRADLLLAGATKAENEPLTLSTTASLEYRLLPWNARLVAGLGQTGTGLSTSLRLGYEPSADTSVWVGYQLVDYGQGDQKPTTPPANQAKAGLTIRF